MFRQYVRFLVNELICEPYRGQFESGFAMREVIVSSTYLSLHYHLVFSTKHRTPAIAQRWRNELFSYMGGTIKGLDGFPEKIGGTADHVHLLVGLRATHRLADVLRDLKKAATDWVHEQVRVPEFSWQEGYAAFTVSPTTRDQVFSYIENQEEHHRKLTFREELMGLLERAGMEFDPKYLD